MADQQRCEGLVNLGRRHFLTRGALTAAGGVAAVVTTPKPANAAPAAAAAARVNYPTSRLANIKDLKVNEPHEVAYPDADSPGVILKLGQAVAGGVGPQKDIVAFSTLCPHKGFPLSYVAEEKVLNCPGHFSRFDVENGGQEIWGHATQNLAQFTLTVDKNGDIFAHGVDELIYGRLSNVV